MMRLFSYLIAFAGVVALTMTASSSTTPESNLPNVPSVNSVAVNPTAEIDSEVVEMKNWNDTKLKSPAKATRVRR
jgi:hypothetical protein